MEKRDLKGRLLEYNRLFKENNEIYRGVAKFFGMGDSAFWILYSLREATAPLTQSEISSILCQPKQTVNSALKKLEAEGAIRMFQERDRRRKMIQLTKLGEELAEKTVDVVFETEQRALAKMTEEELDHFLGLYEWYTELLKEEMIILKTRRS